MKTKNNFSAKGKALPLLVILLSGMVLFSCKKNNNAPPTPKNISFSGMLSGQAEIPSVSTSATGSVTATYNPATKMLSYTFTWSNLSGAPIAMHFHDGAAGTNGAVVVPVSGFPATASGSVSGTSSPLNDTLVNDLMAGKFYGNIHTQSNPGGEIRAQMSKQ